MGGCCHHNSKVSPWRISKRSVAGRHRNLRGLVFDEECPSSKTFRCQWCGVLPVVEDADQEHLRRFHDSWTRGTKLTKPPWRAEPASHWEAILCKRSHLMSTKDMTNECLPGCQIVLFRTTSWCLHTNLNTWTLVYPIQHHAPIQSHHPSLFHCHDSIQRSCIPLQISQFHLHSSPAPLATICSLAVGGKRENWTGFPGKKTNQPGPTLRLWPLILSQIWPVSKQNRNSPRISVKIKIGDLKVLVF